MRVLAALLVCAPAWALPPITPEEAERFHRDGRCAMMARGTGLTRVDGDGWITSIFPGPHRLRAPGGKVWPEEMDITPGRTNRVRVLPQGTPLEWCPAFKPSGRDECGPVPSVLLWDASKVTDRIPSP